MTVHQVPTVQKGVEISVPLNKLRKSPHNARKTPHTPADVETLAASIAAKGVLQSPVVQAERDGQGRETGAYLVTIGEGRRLALCLLAKRKTIGKAEPIRCLLDEGNDALEISLDENVTRFAMHPADQFEAFQTLAETKGLSADEIAVRFGVSAHTVRQRLRLAAVSPRLITAYRSGDLTLEQLMAFGVSDDHARQEQVFEGLSYNRSPGCIRRLMTEHEVPANDRRAVLVGVEAYEAAGGRVRRDLFAEDQGGWFEDVGLLDRLVLAHLTTEAEEVRSREGWLWAEAHVDYPHGHGLRRIYPARTEPDAETRARLDALAGEYDALIAEVSETESPSDAVERRLAELDALLQETPAEAYDPAWVARAGVFAVLDRNGTVRIERGLVRTADEPAAADAQDTPDAPPDEPSGERKETRKDLSDTLILDLTAHRTGALRDALALNPAMAHFAALHALALQTFGLSATESCLELKTASQRLNGLAEGFPASPAGQAILARHEAWAARLPTRADAFWGALLNLSEDERQHLFAHCVALTLNAVRGIGRSPRSLTHADQLAHDLGLDMRGYWKATAESYFQRVSKAHILEAVTEGVSAEAAERLRDLKKDAMARATADLLGAEGWLPPLMRPAAAIPA